MATILIDQNIISHGDTLSSKKVNDVIGYIRKPILKGWQKDEFECLPTISYLAKIKKVTLYRYFELNMEDWKRKDASNMKLGQLFYNNLLKTLPAVMPRGAFFQYYLNEFLETSSVEKYCIWLKSDIPRSLITDGIIRVEQPNEILKYLKRYRELCKGLNNTQCIDALHLWHGEIHNLDYFLTMDKKFMNAIETYKSTPSCIPIMPSQLLKQLEIERREKFEFSVGYFYGIGGNKIFKLV